jgi:Mg/Co/Ni transporter MgtE
MKLKVTKFVDEIIDIPVNIIQPFIEVREDISEEERRRLKDYLKNTHGEIIDIDIASVYNGENVFYEE